MYLTFVTIHVLAALVWLGGMFFFGLVGAPALRAIEDATLRQQLFNTLGLRFRTIGWICIAILVVTGVANLYYRGWLTTSGALGLGAFWGTRVGIALGVKLTAVLVMIIVSAVHDFVLGPAAGRLRASSPEAAAMRRRAAWLGRLNALLGIAVVLAAVQLPRA